MLVDPDAAWLRSPTVVNNACEKDERTAHAVARHEGSVLSLQSFKDTISGETPAVDAEYAQEHLDTSLGAWFSDRLPTLKEAEDIVQNFLNLS